MVLNSTMIYLIMSSAAGESPERKIHLPLATNMSPRMALDSEQLVDLDLERELIPGEDRSELYPPLAEDD
ncbi:hypothetical protein N0V88_004934 [Collariella sp. IMI 366227]|nr:hypothetical protein N0V88_004934 [Collariella sp. IMI 366227]